MNQAAKIMMQLIEIPNRDDRTRALQQLSGQNEDLQREVEGLLVAMEAMGDFLESPAIFGRDAMEILFPELDGLEDVEGRRFIPMGPIGEGGMGSVWLARQTKPLERMVAIKLVKSGLNSQTAISRFESERQLLARLQHPNIATILDAGLLKRGSPFFVMEFVNGLPITEFAAANQLTAGECLRLMISVCRAIEHAHGRGIIHRDIKPGNVLVTLIDGTAIPKVIDFGIARAISAETSDDAGSEKLRAMTGTPAYTAPELWGGDRGRISECSDVYALGVLLRELLLQTLPGSQSTSTDRPGDASAAHETTIETRSTPVTESSVFPETLQTIINLATHSNPDLRYRSAKQLADALAEYLPQVTVASVQHAEIRPRPDLFRVLAFAVCSLLIWGGWMLSGRPWSIGEPAGLPGPSSEEAQTVPGALPLAADVDAARSALLTARSVRRGDFGGKRSIDGKVLEQLRKFWSPLASLTGTSVSQCLLRAEARSALGMLMMLGGDLQGAATALQQAAGEFRSLLSDANRAAAARPFLAETLRHLAVVRYCQGARKESRLWFQESVSFSDDIQRNPALAESGLNEAWQSQWLADNLLEWGYCEEAAGEYLLAAEQLLQGGRPEALAPAVLPMLFACTHGRAVAVARTSRRSSAVSIACRATELGGLMRVVCPSSVEVDSAVAEACLLAGQLLAEAGRAEEALELLQRGGDLIQGTVPTETESGSRLRIRMAVAQALADVAERRQQPEQALFMLMMALRDDWRPFWLHGMRSESDVAAGVRLLQQLGDMAGRLQRYPLAIASYLEGLEVCAESGSLTAASRYFAEQQTSLRLELAEIRFAIGDVAEAARELEAARTGYLKLLQTVPNDNQFRRRLARCWYRLGQTQLQSGGQSTTAINSLREGVEIYESLLVESPGDVELRLEAASCLLAGGEFLLKEREFGTSVQWLKRCTKMLVAGLGLKPQEPRFSELLTKTLYSLNAAENQDRTLLDKP